ncbi:MAG: RagB/SusD family nutrient uptake outer membrane protein [Odoribacteraceae bacterium]|jgi:hypothetical protein|nr:RagB/SusD family nutrient uptake outer membrane protein [Odoribacteraceae bacterium]
MNITHIIKKSLLPILAGAAMCQSCNFLDIDPYITDLATMDSVFKRQEYVQQYLNNVYSYIPDPGALTVSQSMSLPWVLITDEGMSTVKRAGHPYNYFANNELSSDDLYGYSSRWNDLYEGIRKADIFLRDVHKCTEATDLKRQEWAGEAIFLKAYLYFELMLMFGPVPIAPPPVSLDTQIEELFIERDTWDACSDHVTGLLKEAIRLLPTFYPEAGDIGKPTKNSAMAVLSRLTLYTASPLYNGENAEFSGFINTAGVPYLNPDKNNEKWGVAAASAKQLVEIKPADLYTIPSMHNTPRPPVPASDQAAFPNGVGGIDHFHSYSDMFNGVCQLASDNMEILFSRQGTSVNAANRYLSPTITNGYASVNLTQNLVDAYYMANGRTIQDATPDCPYDTGYTTNDSTFSGQRETDGFTILGGTHRWYLNREMRFYATVVFNNSYVPSISTPAASVNLVDGRVAKFYFNSQSGKDLAATTTWGAGAIETELYPMTGYLCRKFIGPEDSWHGAAHQTTKYMAVYRMAEVYLNYVEAMNELEQPYTIDGVTVSRDAAEMKKYFNMIRYRAGLPGITDSDAADKQRMRDLILRERQIEFAWEGRRYFDLRRTKQAVIYENQPVRGVNVDARSTDPDAFHTIVRVNQRAWTYKVFTSRQTFFPILKTEINKNPKLQQLPGY